MRKNLWVVLIGVMIMGMVIPAAAQEEKPSPIAWVRAEKEQITLQLRRTGGKGHIVARDTWESNGKPPSRTPVWQGTFSGQRITVPRYDSQKKDLLFQRFQAVAENDQHLGPPQWVTDLSGLPVRTQPIPWPKSIKGVQCVVDMDDAIALGVKHVGVNLSIRDFLMPGPNVPVEMVTVDGEEIPINMETARRFDAEIRRFTQAGINITPIVLNYFPRNAPADDPLLDPRTDRKEAPNALAAFNLSAERGARLYRAVFLFLAKRYSEPNAPYGRVSGFIIGNEIQSHWHWYNLGHISKEDLVRQYADALRLAWLAVRSVHSGLRVYVSMDIHWTRAYEDPDRTMPGRYLLDQLNALGKGEGDYDWHIAHHPYPEGLFDPVFWDDEEAGMGFDSPLITFKNLEVLTAYLNRPDQQYRAPAGGKAVTRRVILSEQGFNCKDETEAAEAMQAAAYAYAYQKVSHMPGIDAFILHRHCDHRGEGGLKLGLIAEKPGTDQPSIPGKRRKMWYVAQKADTPEWESAFAFALPLIGLKSWNEALPFAGKIGENSGIDGKTHYPGTVVYDLLDNQHTAKAENYLDWRRARAKNKAGRSVYGLFLHPKKVGPAEAIFTIALPKVPKGKGLIFRSEALNSAQQPSPNGIRFTALVDDKELWTGEARSAQQPEAVAIDLTAYAGKTIRLTLRTDALGGEANAWATWLSPVVLLE